MTESVTRYEATPLKLFNPGEKSKVTIRKSYSIGMVQLAEVLRLVERQMPIVLNTNIDKEEKEYILYLADRALKVITGGCCSEISV